MKLYLTFDDGPLGGTDDVIEVLTNAKLKGTLFMVASHITGRWRKKVLQQAQENPWVEIANHSNHHAHNRYRRFYSQPDTVLTDFESANQPLGIAPATTIHSRLPGRNTWRTQTITKTDGDSGPAADLLHNNGYALYGWDVEWNMRSGLPSESVDSVMKKIAHCHTHQRAKKPGHIVLLMHDTMFRASKGGRTKLEEFVAALEKTAYETAFISEYHAPETG